MEITDIKIFLSDSPPDKRLKAYATVTFDNVFVVRNIKIIEGTSGLFIAMPSRKGKHPCPKCNFKNELRSKYCNQCGADQPSVSCAPTMAAVQGISGYKDIVHPITQSFRDYLEKKILDDYGEKKDAGSKPERILDLKQDFFADR